MRITLYLYFSPLYLKLTLALLQFWMVWIQNLDSMQVKISWFAEKNRALSMALSLCMWWCFNVWYIFLQQWNLVSFSWLHKPAKLSCLEFGELSHFLSNDVASLKNWCLVRYESQTHSRTNFYLRQQLLHEIYHNIIQ